MHTVVVDNNLMIRYVDLAFAALIGRSREYFVGLHLDVLFNAEGIRALRNWMEGLDAETQLPDLQLLPECLNTQGGTIRWTACRISDDRGSPSYTVLSSNAEDTASLHIEDMNVIRHLDALFEDSSMAIWVSDRNCVISYFNQGAVKLSCFSQKEATSGLSLFDLFNDRSEVEAALSVIEETGFLENKPMMLGCRDGSQRPVRVSMRSVPDTSGAALGTVGVAIDRSEELSIAAELESLYRQLASFSSTTAEVISQDDTAKLFQQIAKAISEISDFGRVLISIFMEEAPYREIIAYSGVEEKEFEKLKKIPMDRERLKEFMKEEFRLSENCFYIPGTRKEVFKKDEVVYGTRGSYTEGAWRPDDNLMVTLKHGNEILGYISVDDSKSGRRPTGETVKPLELFANQITQVLVRNQLQEELHNRHRDLQLLYDISVIVNSSLDAEEVLQKLVEIIYERMNYFQVSVYLLEEGVLVKKALFGEELQVASTAVEVGKGIIGHAAQEGQVVISNNVLEDDRYVVGIPGTRSEIAIPIKSTAIVEGEETEGIIGVLNVESDVVNAFSEDDGRRLELIANTASIAIENSRLMNRVLSLLKEEANYSLELEEKKGELDEFVHTISHDLKSPLNSINGYAEMLEIELGKNLDSEIKRFLKRIRANVESVSRMINALLELSRVGRVVEQSQKVRLLKLLDEIRFDIHASGKSERAEIKYVNLPETVTADRRLFTQLFTNLIQNAYKYRHPDRRPEITIGCEDDGQNYKFYVSDNGIGIDSQHLSSIFVFGIRLREKEVEGTGAGLAIAKKIVETLGGRIWVESVKDVGSTFFFTLPK